MFDDGCRGQRLAFGREIGTALVLGVDEVDIAQLDSYELAWMRCHKIGYIFQTFNLIPVMTSLENVMIADDFRGGEHG